MRTPLLMSGLLVFLSGMYVGADPPKIVLEPVIEARGDYVTFTPKTDAVSITYVGFSGVDPFPVEMLKDPRAFILPVRGLKEGTYKFAAVGASAKGEQTRADFAIKIGKGSPEPAPTPGPTPQPDPPKPDPKFDNAPVQTSGLHVVFVFEAGQRINQNQFNTLYGATTRNYLDTNCDRTNSQPNWRLIDQNQQPVGEFYKDVMKRIRTSVPWVVIVVNKQYVYEGPLKESPEEFVKLVDKYRPAVRTDYCPNCPEPYKFQSTPLK